MNGRMKSMAAVAAALCLAIAGSGGPVAARDGAILVQSTTSTANSGLYDYLLPLFEQASGVRVDVVAVGTGQAIRNARNCDGDILLVHAKAAEEKFVADGFGTVRADLMYNDFVLVGPASDPAEIAVAQSAAAALSRIAERGAPFASRGDDSGTHKKELALWRAADVDPTAASGSWYLETGSGMGATLNTGVGVGAYVLTDRATWIRFANKGSHRILVEGGDDMFNQYGVIPVSKAACPSVNARDARMFFDWLLSDAGQEAIARYRVAGHQLFFPNGSGD